MPQFEWDELAQAIDEWALYCWEIADEKGWHEPNEKEGVVRDASAVERQMLIVSEVAEMMEAWRVSKGDYTEIDGKPEGVGAELADVMIRCLDYAKIYQIPLGSIMLQKCEYNKTRSYRHGGKTV